MTVWDPVEIAQIWIGAGGTSEGAILQWVVCVALAESGGNDHAANSGGDRGLWQINDANFDGVIINNSNWFNPTVNARKAIAMSGNGQNWAAWCTAWANPDGNCGHGYIHTPQQGSPAYRFIWDVQKDLAGSGHLVGNTVGTGIGSILIGSTGSAWSQLQAYHHSKAPAQWAVLHSTRGAFDALTRRI